MFDIRPVKTYNQFRCRKTAAFPKGRETAYIAARIAKKIIKKFLTITKQRVKI